MWLSVEGELIPITLRIPREFYLNFKSEPQADEYEEYYSREKVTRLLPRSRPCMHLYKYSMSEEIFTEGESHFSSEINNVNVDGAYELQVGIVTGPRPTCLVLMIGIL